MAPDLKVQEHAARHVLSSTGLRKEGVEGIVAATDGLVSGHLAIRLDAVLEAVELPAGIADLDTGLADMDTVEGDGRLNAGVGIIKTASAWVGAQR